MSLHNQVHHWLLTYHLTRLHRAARKRGLWFSEWCDVTYDCQGQRTEYVAVLCDPAASFDIPGVQFPAPTRIAALRLARRWLRLQPKSPHPLVDNTRDLA